MRPISLLCACAALLISGCGSWPVQPGSYNPPTPMPSRTPEIETATPRILTPIPLTATAPTGTATLTDTASSPTLVEVTPSQTSTPTLVPSPAAALSTDILGCDTGIDVLHGMGEVTNAYVRIANPTAVDVPDLCATLRALDEGRPHPDKTKCLPSLPAGYQVTFKLTVDSTFKQDTPVQVDVTSGEDLLQRAGEPACTAIGLFLPTLDDLDVARPIP